MADPMAKQMEYLREFNNKSWAAYEKDELDINVSISNATTKRVGAPNNNNRAFVYMASQWPIICPSSCTWTR